MQSAAVEALGLVSGFGSKGTRRSYSDEEKRRIVAAACEPGASVADVARQYGVNANLLFNWRKLGRRNGSAGVRPAAGVATQTDGAAFIPLGVFGRTEGEGPGLIAAPSQVPGGKAGAALSRVALDARPGVIEIDLTDGTRVRVDGFVDERSLRCVLAALKAAS